MSWISSLCHKYQHYEVGDWRVNPPNSPFSMINWVWCSSRLSVLGWRLLSMVPNSSSSLGSRATVPSRQCMAVNRTEMVVDCRTGGNLRSTSSPRWYWPTGWWRSSRLTPGAGLPFSSRSPSDGEGWNIAPSASEMSPLCSATFWRRVGDLENSFDFDHSIISFWRAELVMMIVKDQHPPSPG